MKTNVYSNIIFVITMGLSVSSWAYGKEFAPNYRDLIDSTVSTKYMDTGSRSSSSYTCEVEKGNELPKLSEKMRLGGIITNSDVEGASFGMTMSYQYNGIKSSFPEYHKSGDTWSVTALENLFLNGLFSYYLDVLFNEEIGYDSVYNYEMFNQVAIPAENEMLTLKQLRELKKLPSYEQTIKWLIGLVKKLKEDDLRSEEVTKLSKTLEQLQEWENLPYKQVVEKLQELAKTDSKEAEKLKNLIHGIPKFGDYDHRKHASLLSFSELRSGAHDTDSLLISPAQLKPMVSYLTAVKQGISLNDKLSILGAIYQKEKIVLEKMRGQADKIDVSKIYAQDRFVDDTQSCIYFWIKAAMKEAKEYYKRGDLNNEAVEHYFQGYIPDFFKSPRYEHILDLINKCVVTTP